jgi:hypothetical protein
VKEDKKSRFGHITLLQIARGVATVELSPPPPQDSKK